jgi:hypothetical protein
VKVCGSIQWKQKKRPDHSASIYMSLKLTNHNSASLVLDEGLVKTKYGINAALSFNRKIQLENNQK